MSDRKTPAPEIVSREAWLAARKTLLEHEKALTRQKDKVNVERRRLPIWDGDVCHTYSAYARGTAGVTDAYA